MKRMVQSNQLTKNNLKEIKGAVKRYFVYIGNNFRLLALIAFIKNN